MSWSIDLSLPASTSCMRHFISERFDLSLLLLSMLHVFISVNLFDCLDSVIVQVVVVFETFEFSASSIPRRCLWRSLSWFDILSMRGCLRPWIGLFLKLIFDQLYMYMSWSISTCMYLDHSVLISQNALICLCVDSSVWRCLFISVNLFDCLLWLC